MTERAGTPRYMAPEVLSNRPYGLPSDVYSWSILSWEVLTEEKPFEGTTSWDRHVVMVCDKGHRPDTTACGDCNDATQTRTRRRIPAEMKPLLERSWSSEPSDR